MEAQRETVERFAAARIADSASTSTTQPYGRTDEALTLDEIERIHI